MILWAIDRGFVVSDVSADVLGGVAVYVDSGPRSIWFACMNDMATSAVSRDAHCVYQSISVGVVLPRELDGLAIGWLVLGVAWCIALSAELRRDVDAPFLPMLTAVLIPVIAVGALVLGYVSEVPLIARFHLSEPSMNTIADELADAGGNGVSTVTSRTCVPFYCFSKVTRQGDRVEFSFASRLWEDTPGQFIRVDPAEGRVAPGDNSIDLGSGWYYVRPLLI